MPTTNQSAELRELKSLAGEPARQAAFAASLLQPHASRQVLEAAVEVLARTPVAEARPAILAVYQDLASKGPKRDQGAFLRRAVLDALRPLAVTADIPILLQAVTTYEFLPPDFKEEASLLRGSALLALNEVDDELAAYHAARLLVDEHTEEMSGEPAVTAARVLASQDRPLPLYQVVMSPMGTVLADVICACLQNLTAIPATLVPGIVDRYRDSTSASILLGLFDLLIGHQAGPQELPFLEQSLARLKDTDLYRYLLIALLSARNKQLDELVIRSGRFESDQKKLAVLLEVLEVFDLGEEGEALVSKLSSRVRQPRRW